MISSPNKPLSIDICGCGDLFFRTLLPRFESEAGRARFTLAGLFNPSGEEHYRLADRLEGAHAYSSYETMLAESSSDAVLVLCPAHFHCEQTLKALKAGKHVYVQKPLAASAGEVDAMMAEAETRDRVLIAAPVQGVYPTIHQLAGEIERGTIGEIYYATAPFMGWSGMDVEAAKHPGWRYEKGDGPLRDHGIYSLVSLVTILGHVESVSAFSEIKTDHRKWKGERFEVTEHDNTAALLRFESGALVSLHEAWCPCPETSAPPMRIFGLGGVLETFGGRWDACPQGYILYGTDGAILEKKDVLASEAGRDFDDGGPNPHVWRDLLHLSECVSNGIPPVSTPTLVRHVYAIIDAIYEAAATGCRQTPAR
jgi:predicted dehydrogenase